MVLDLPSTLKLTWKPEDVAELTGLSGQQLSGVFYSAEESWVEFFHLDDQGNKIYVDHQPMKTRQYLIRKMSDHG